MSDTPEACWSSGADGEGLQVKELLMPPFHRVRTAVELLPTAEHGK